MRIELAADGADITLAISDIGPVAVKLPRSWAEQAVKAALRKRRLAGDGYADVAGIFDEIGKGLTFFKKQILDNPLVRGVVSVIPYGGAALAAADMVEAGVNLGKQALSRQPAAVRKTVAAAALGNKKARARVAKARLAARRGNPRAKADAAAIAVNAKLMMAMKQLEDLKAQMRAGRLPQAQELPPPMPPEIFEPEYEEEAA